MKKWKCRMFLGVVAITMALGLALFSPSPAHAVEYYLSELLAGQNVTIGDKIFSNWGGFSSIATGGAQQVDPAGVLVTFTMVSENFFTVRYQGAVWSAGTGQTQDTFFSYDVSTVGGAARIHDDTLRLIVAATVGTGSLSIGEQIIDAADVFLGSKLVSMNETTNIIFDEVVWDPARNFIHVSKDIGLVGGNAGSAFISDWEQGYSQIPEPTTVILLGSGLLGAALYRRLRKPKG